VFASAVFEYSLPAQISRQKLFPTSRKSALPWQMPHKPAPRRGHCRVPAFAPVPLRSRAGGWTPAKQAAFLGALAVTGSVREAARRVGMSRMAAYRLRSRAGAESFAAAWDTVLRRRKPAPPNVTRTVVRADADYYLLKPVIYAGRHVATVRKPDNSALLRHLAQLDRSERAGAAGPAAVGSFAPRSGSTSGHRRR
jgi:hypothetical protein